MVRSFWFAKKWGLNRYRVKRVFSGVWGSIRELLRQLLYVLSPDPIHPGRGNSRKDPEAFSPADDSSMVFCRVG